MSRRRCPPVPRLRLIIRVYVVVCAGGAITRGSRNTMVVNMSGMPEEHQARRVKIFQPAPRNTHFARPRAPMERKKWTLEYDKASNKQGKWVNPLMVRPPFSPRPAPADAAQVPLGSLLGGQTALHRTFGRWAHVFCCAPRWQGWTSTSDPLSNLNVSFTSKETAIEFCNRNGLAYEVLEPKVMRRQIKSYGDNFRYWGRVVNHHTKTNPTLTHGIDVDIKDQAILTNLDKLSPETANSSVFPKTQPKLASDPRGAGTAAGYGREEWGGKGVPKPPSARAAPTNPRPMELTPPPAFQGERQTNDV